mmetsp:Transcript_16870/g.37962  ORF Transcript_16870/g.37962 Transcript_16870/m.37962 type:complete len:195 (+) Transcript_16870:719-1303(+)
MAFVELQHLYIPLGPLYFNYFLFQYCYNDGARKERKFSWFRFLGLAFFTLISLLLPFVPFLQPPGDIKQLSQIFRRLFPFARGLCHDYWAGNIWALYLGMNKVIFFVSKLRIVQHVPLVRSFIPIELPSVSPSTTAVLLLLSLLPAMYTSLRIGRLPRKKNSRKTLQVNPGLYFVHALVSYTFFCRLSVLGVWL